MALMFDQTEDVLDGKKLVFLIGAPRSGTTWLQLLLARSPFVVTAQETHLFNVFLSSIVDEWNRLRKGSQRTGVSLVLVDEEFRRLLRNTSGCVLAKIAQSKPSATVVLDKTPDHVRCWREILEAWPQAHFIHIIRDPRSVVASLRVASRSWAASWASSRISRNCDRWIGDVSSGRQIQSVTPNYQEVFYEQLISDGPNVVMRLMTGLGIPSNRDECRRYFEECNIENLRAGKLSGAPFDVAKMNKESWRIGKTDSWRVELSAWEIALVEHLAGPLMSELGFAPANNGRVMAAASSLGWSLWDAARAAKRRLRRFRDSSHLPQN